ncbi:g9549 [Coccomyxa elongata]
MSSGEVNRKTVEGQTTGTGAPKETFGTGAAAQSEAGHKGADISSGRSKEALQEAGRKAARTRAERYGEELKVSDPQNDDLQGTKTTV